MQVTESIMRAISIMLVALAAPLVMCYDEKFDKLDVDKIIGDDTLFTGYTNCLLDKGPCDLEHSEEFKSLLPELVATACAKCSPIQRQHVRKSFKALSEKKPTEFSEFRRKYDPNGQYEAAMASFLLSTD